MAPSPRNDAAADLGREAGPHCPVCHAPVAPDAKVFPFCSPRCKLIDLGRWLGDRYRIESSLDETDRDVPPDEDAPPDDGQEA